MLQSTFKTVCPPISWILSLNNGINTVNLKYTWRKDKLQEEKMYAPSELLQSGCFYYCFELLKSYLWGFALYSKWKD